MCCFGIIPIHFFCIVIPVQKSVNVIAFSSILLFAWNLIFNIVIVGSIFVTRYEYGYLRLVDAFMPFVLNLIADCAMIWVSLLLVWRETHLLWLAYSVFSLVLQVTALAMSTSLDFVHMYGKYLITFTLSRLLAGFDLYLIWMAFMFNWTIVVYLWLCVLSIYLISRLPDNYDEIKENEAKKLYIKERAKEANQVYEEIVNDMYLKQMDKLDKVE